MEWINVESSDLDAVSYDVEKSILYIRFRDGSAYRYFGVLKSKYDSLLKAYSKGRYFSANIKHCYRYEKML